MYQRSAHNILFVGINAFRMLRAATAYRCALNALTDHPYKRRSTLSVDWLPRKPYCLSDSMTQWRSCVPSSVLLTQGSSRDRQANTEICMKTVPPGFPSLVINASLQSTLSVTMVEHIRHHCWSSYVHKSSELAWYTVRAWTVYQAGNTCYATRNTSWPQSPLPKRTPERPHISLCRRPLHIIFLRHLWGKKVAVMSWISHCFSESSNTTIQLISVRFIYNLKFFVNLSIVSLIMQPSLFFYISSFIGFSHGGAMKQFLNLKKVVPLKWWKALIQIILLLYLDKR